MAVKPTPINLPAYYKSMRDTIMPKKDEAEEQIGNLILQVKALSDECKEYIQEYKDNFNLNVMNFKEFVENKYISGKLLATAKRLFLNRKNDYELNAALFSLLKLARVQKDLHEVNKKIELYNKLLDLSFHEYRRIIRAFYNEVHKKLILEGKGYAFEGRLGWTCINRYKRLGNKTDIDYAATKKKKEEILARGGTLYDKKDAQLCLAQGIEYDGEDPRVYRTVEYEYELPLIHCCIPGIDKYKMKVADYRGSDVRGKTNEEIIEECKHSPKLICNKPLDVKTKLTLSLQCNKLLYTKFIRNENQEPATLAKINRKNRQRL